MIGRPFGRILSILLLLLAVVACAGPPANTPLPPPAAPAAVNPATAASSYRLGSGDRIRLTVFRHDDLSGEFSLDGAGNFAMPLLGEIQAYGLTTRELEQKLVDRLKDGYLVDPQVSVEVMNYRPFYILGEVARPGSYPYVNGMSVLNAVALAGGFTYRAKQSDFLLQRGGSNTPAADVGGDAALLPGDVITVQERFF